MDAKLKALKVADLKDILVKASVPVAARTNKQDLIAKILASPAAVKVYEQRHAPAGTASTAATPAKPAPVESNNDDLLAPPEVFDWTAVDAEEPSPVTAPAPGQNNPSSTQPPPAKPAQVPPTDPSTGTTSVTATSAPAPVPLPAASQTSQGTPGDDDLERRRARAERFGIPLPSPTALKTNQPAPVDDDLEKRKARAERFGIPLVEPKKIPQPQLQNNGRTKRAAAALEGLEKIQKRAERLGLSPSSEQPVRRGAKRTAPPEEVDAEELERRRKRAERFKIPAT
ncbi:hypothetical protein SCLCIDRAFT_1213914 [Scleroderma citrinum Foug A]|uniref:THO1-MOS11 C-terminal domain-containing protein n=1 Tax=Scleroderma citrinum Foug A TaxID=1036808 RepID=A0A0C2ZQB7_9AGAM|nr:hypothetical protein SCLCIDRAFT_1213914 [Scleroderma citrinum Foug A]